MVWNDHETGNNHCRDSPKCHFYCPVAEADFSGGHCCQWGEHYNQVEHFGCIVPAVLAFMLWRENRK
jgi:hypothetical protein